MSGADILQIVGAILILIGFAAVQAKRMSPDSRIYLWLNLVGSLILGVLAAVGEQWGFLLLEAAWVAVSAWSLVKLMRGRPPWS